MCAELSTEIVIDPGTFRDQSIKSLNLIYCSVYQPLDNEMVVESLKFTIPNNLVVSS